MLGKRLTALLLAAVLCLGLASCSMGREHIVIRDHSETYTEHSDSDVFTVRNYNGLKNALWYMVTERMEYMVLQLYNFGEDVNNQIYEACMEVQRNTPIGAYAVDYFVTPGCDYLVSCYEAEISVNYRVTEEQMAQLTRVPNLWTARDEFEACLEARDDYAAFWINSFALDEEYMTDIFNEYYYENPFFAISVPQLTVTRYMDGADRIIETGMDYAHNNEAYTRIKDLVMEKTTALITELGPHSVSRDTALNICSVLADAASYDAAGARSLNTGSPRDDRFTLYGTLCKDNAVGEGYAVAFELLCRLVGIECDIVVGTLSNFPHAWNRLTIDGETIYVDCAMFDHLGRNDLFDMSADYMEDQGYIETAVY